MVSVGDALAHADSSVDLLISFREGFVSVLDVFLAPVSFSEPALFVVFLSSLRRIWVWLPPEDS